jgi:hypothetical protein
MRTMTGSVVAAEDGQAMRKEVEHSDQYRTRRARSRRAAVRAHAKPSPGKFHDRHASCLDGPHHPSLLNIPGSPLYYTPIYSSFFQKLGKGLLEPPVVSPWPCVSSAASKTFTISSNFTNEWKLILVLTEVDLSNGMLTNFLPNSRPSNTAGQATDTMDYSAGDER